MEEKFIDIGVQLNVLESLSRILLEAIRDGENLKDYDISNLALIVLGEVTKLKNNVNNIELDMGI